MVRLSENSMLNPRAMETNPRIVYSIACQLPSKNATLIQIDERNQKTRAKYVLEEYLNTELCLSGIYSKKLGVKYFDSCNNRLIQLADVMANILYSNLRTQNYDKEINAMKKKGYIKKIFDFPKKLLPESWQRFLRIIQLGVKSKTQASAIVLVSVYVISTALEQLTPTIEKSGGNIVLFIETGGLF